MKRIIKTILISIVILRPISASEKKENIYENLINMVIGGIMMGLTNQFYDLTLVSDEEKEQKEEKLNESNNVVHGRPYLNGKKEGLKLVKSNSNDTVDSTIKRRFNNLFNGLPSILNRKLEEKDVDLDDKNIPIRMRIASARKQINKKQEEKNDAKSSSLYMKNVELRKTTDKQEYQKLCLKISEQENIVKKREREINEIRQKLRLLKRASKSEEKEKKVQSVFLDEGVRESLQEKEDYLKDLNRNNREKMYKDMGINEQDEFIKHNMFLDRMPPNDVPLEKKKERDKVEIEKWCKILSFHNSSSMLNDEYDIKEELEKEIENLFKKLIIKGYRVVFNRINNISVKIVTVKEKARWYKRKWDKVIKNIDSGPLSKPDVGWFLLKCKRNILLKAISIENKGEVPLISNNLMDINLARLGSSMELTKELLGNFYVLKKEIDKKVKISFLRKVEDNVLVNVLKNLQYLYGFYYSESRNNRLWNMSATKEMKDTMERFTEKIGFKVRLLAAQIEMNRKSKIFNRSVRGICGNHWNIDLEGLSPRSLVSYIRLDTKCELGLIDDVYGTGEEEDFVIKEDKFGIDTQAIKNRFGLRIKINSENGKE